MESKNPDKLSLLIDFLRSDAKGEGAKEGLGNVELAAADYLSDHFLPVISKIDCYDEAAAPSPLLGVKVESPLMAL